MRNPGTRHFIGPLTPKQQRRRIRNQQRFQYVSEIMEARCVTFAEALKIYHAEKRLSFSYLT